LLIILRTVNFSCGSKEYTHSFPLNQKKLQEILDRVSYNSIDNNFI